MTQIGFAFLTFAFGVAGTMLLNPQRIPISTSTNEGKSSEVRTQGPVSCEGVPDIPKSAKVALDRRFPGWKFPSVTSDVCQFLKHSVSRDAIPSFIKGDFDGDGRPDNAALIEYGQVANNGGLTSPNVYVVALMNTISGAKLRILERHGSYDYLVTIPKGLRDYDYETGLNFTYPEDAIFAVIFEKAGTSYLYEKGRFRSIITSD